MELHLAVEALGGEGLVLGQVYGIEDRVAEADHETVAEERRVGCKRRQAAYSSLAGLRRSRTPFRGGRVFQRATNCSYDFSACSAI